MALTTWSSLVEGIQLEIYEFLLVDLKHPAQVALALGLSRDELHSVQTLYRRRKMFPLTVDQIWAQYSSTGEGHSGYIDPTVLQKLMPYITFASACDWREHATENQLEIALFYLRKVGMPMVRLLQIFAAHLRAIYKYNEGEAYPAPNPSSNYSTHENKAAREFAIALGEVDIRDQDGKQIRDLIHSFAAIPKGIDDRDQASSMLKEGVAKEKDVHNDMDSQLTREANNQLPQARNYRRETISTDSTISIELSYIDAGPVVVPPEFDIARGMPNNPWTTQPLPENSTASSEQTEEDEARREQDLWSEPERPPVSPISDWDYMDRDENEDVGTGAGIPSIIVTDWDAIQTARIDGRLRRSNAPSITSVSDRDAMEMHEINPTTESSMTFAASMSRIDGFNTAASRENSPESSTSRVTKWRHDTRGEDNEHDEDDTYGAKDAPVSGCTTN